MALDWPLSPVLNFGSKFAQVFNRLEQHKSGKVKNSLDWSCSIIMLLFPWFPPSQLSAASCSETTRLYIPNTISFPILFQVNYLVTASHSTSIFFMSKRGKIADKCIVWVSMFLIKTAQNYSKISETAVIADNQTF